METAIALAKCRLAAEKLVPAFEGLGTETIKARIATELLAARADAVRQYLDGFSTVDEFAYEDADAMDAEVRGRREGGL